VKTYADVQILTAKKAQIRNGDRVLDCGTGPAASLALRLAKLVGEKGKVVAIDCEREYIPKIKDAIAKSSLSNRVSFLVADLRYTPIRDSSMDASLSLDTVQNMHGNGGNPEDTVKAYIKESARAIKSGGKLVVGTRFPVPRNVAQRAYMEYRLFSRKLEYALWKEISRYYFEHELISWFNEARLRDTEVDIIEHKILFPRDFLSRRRERVGPSLDKVAARSTREELRKEFHKLLKTTEKYGEEWLPTLLISATKTGRSARAK